MNIDRSDVLFVGWGELQGVSWYRTHLPSKELGADCVIFAMDGRGVHRVGTNMTPKVIVLQHGWEHWQVRVMRRMMNSGATVLLNVDDWIPGVPKMGTSHYLSQHFKEESRVDEWKRMVREADGVIASTPWLAERLQSLNPSVVVARNGLDLGRYERHRQPKAEAAAVLGWAGGTGHEGAFRAILPALNELLHQHPHLSLHIKGETLSHLLPNELQDRVKQIAWSDAYWYPGDLAKFDINLAPSLDNNFYKAKSQLRFYEACAMGTPTVGGPIYDEIPESGAGYIARNPDDYVSYISGLINNPHALNRCRSRALDYCQSISIENRIDEWKTAIETLTNSSLSLASA